MTPLSRRCPQRLGNVWSSSWIAPAPARSRTAHRALNVQRIAVAGVGVDDQRRRDAVADQSQRIRHFRQGHEADIGTSEPRVGDARAGDVERLEAGVGGERGGQGIVDAGRDHDAALRDARLERRRFWRSV